MITLDIGDARVVFTDRHGGVSTAPYASANLGDHVGDSPAAVTENRARLARSFAAGMRSGMGSGMDQGGAGPDAGPLPTDPASWVWLRQVHGAEVVTLGRAPATTPEADAAVTTTVGLPLVVLVADCAPIALVGEGAVGVVHAGWAGIERGVVEHAVAEMRRVGGDPIRAVIGPCIHPATYEFGPDLLARLVARLGPGIAARTAGGRPALDVPAAVRAALAAVGVDDVLDVGVCTAESPDYFSARHEGTTGRQGVVVVRTR